MHGSGRTDQGVHARAQVAHVDIARRLTPISIQRALNSRLPADIRISRVDLVDPEFHARCSASSKEYRYFAWNDEVLPPAERLYHAHVRRPLDPEAMQAAAVLLVGEHDFAAFTANANRVVESTVRTIYHLKVRRRGRQVVIMASGNGFLYKMVRSLAGCLIKVGEGRETVEGVGEILASRTRTARVPTASPQGLFLWQVKY